MNGRNVVGDYIAYVRPEVTAQDSDKFEQSLIRKATKVGNEIGDKVGHGLIKRLTHQVGQAAWYTGLYMGVYELGSRLLDPKFIEGETAYNTILDNIQKLQQLASQVGASTQQIQKGSNIAAFGGINFQEYQQDLLKIQQLQLQGDPVLANFKGTNQVQNFADIVKSLEGLSKPLQTLYANRIFGSGAYGVLNLINTPGGIDKIIEKINKDPNFKNFNANTEKNRQLIIDRAVAQANEATYEASRGAITANRAGSAPSNYQERYQRMVFDRNTIYIDNLSTAINFIQLGEELGKGMDLFSSAVQGAAVSLTQLKTYTDMAAKSGKNLADANTQLYKDIKSGNTVKSLIESENIARDSLNPFGFLWHNDGVKKIKGQ